MSSPHLHFIRGLAEDLVGVHAEINGRLKNPAKRQLFDGFDFVESQAAGIFVQFHGNPDGASVGFRRRCDV